MPRSVPCAPPRSVPTAPHDSFSPARCYPYIFALITCLADGCMVPWCAHMCVCRVCVWFVYHMCVVCCVSMAYVDVVCMCVPCVVCVWHGVWYGVCRVCVCRVYASSLGCACRDPLPQRHASARCVLCRRQRRPPPRAAVRRWARRRQRAARRPAPVAAAAPPRRSSRSTSLATSGTRHRRLPCVRRCVAASAGCPLAV
jgi:hypothetical protein